MELRAREHVPALTGVLTVVSLGLVFGAVLEVIPAGAIPRAPSWVFSAIPHLNAFVSALAIGTITAGWRYVRRGAIAKHRVMMLTSFGLFALFLAAYLYNVTITGTSAFPGPEPVYRFVYLPLLAVHIGLAIVCVPLLYYVALLGLTHPVSELKGSLHPRVGRIAASLWLVSFSLGIVVYALLYHIY
jgi:putative membrane protein